MDPKNIPKFWSISIKEGQPIKIAIPKSAYLKITNVCLHQVSPSNQGKPGRLYSLSSKHNIKNQQPSILASLYPQQVEQMTLNYTLFSGETAEFSAKGPHQIDLSGYLAPNDFGEEESDFENDESTDDNCDDYE